MRETDIEVILQRAKEKYPEAKPRIISDNGPQFIARDFKEFIRISGMTHVRTSPNYPQSNGKLERWHKSLKSECIRPGTPLSLEDAKCLIQQYVDRYNYLRLHSAIGYVTPKDMRAGHQQEIQAERDRKLDAAKEQRKNRRQRAGVMDETDCSRLADNAELTQRQGQAYIQRSESPRSPEESLYLGTRAAVEGSPSVRQSAAH